MPFPFYYASVVLFQLHRGMVSHMQALATPSSNVHNTWILTTESISVLAAYWQRCREPTIKVQISGRMASIGISDVVTASVYSEKTR